MTTRSYRSKLLSVIACGAFALAAAAPALAADEGAEEQGQGIAWSPGPGEFALGDQAMIDLGEGFLFADGENTRAAMASMGNMPNDLEVGLIAPAGEDENWFVVFEFNPVGYVNDDDRAPGAHSAWPSIATEMGRAPERIPSRSG